MIEPLSNPVDPDDLASARILTLIMLAGTGLRSADTLAEAGWVSTGALPFMGKMHGTAEDDSAVRLLKTNELADTRRLAAGVFGVPEEVGAIVFADALLEQQDCRPLRTVRGWPAKILCAQRACAGPLLRRLGAVHRPRGPAVQLRPTPLACRLLSAPADRPTDLVAHGQPCRHQALPRGGTGHLRALADQVTPTLGLPVGTSSVKPIGPVAVGRPGRKNSSARAIRENLLLSAPRPATYSPGSPDGRVDT